ncbi:MAG: OB-fold nucleic acid binding domain-containing protein, partial [Candidatus Omnitrophota bacterium]
MEHLHEIPIRYLKGIGPKRAKVFSAAGIDNIEDLLYYFPHRYDDRTKLSQICQVEEGGVYTIKGEILLKNHRRSFRRRAFSILELKIGDKTGKLSCVWFNQPYLNDYFKEGQSVILNGKVENYSGRLQMSSPEFEIISGVRAEEDGPVPAEADEALNVGRIVP